MTARQPLLHYFLAECIVACNAQCHSYYTLKFNPGKLVLTVNRLNAESLRQRRLLLFQNVVMRTWDQKPLLYQFLVDFLLSTFRTSEPLSLKEYRMSDTMKVYVYLATSKRMYSVPSPCKNTFYKEKRIRIDAFVFWRSSSFPVYQQETWIALESMLNKMFNIDFIEIIISSDVILEIRNSTQIVSIFQSIA